MLNSSADYQQVTATIKSLTIEPVTDAEKVMLDRVNSIQHMLSPLEPLALNRLCKKLPDKAKILEIGSYQGGSTVAIGHAIAGTSSTLYCVDTWFDFIGLHDFADVDRSAIADDLVVFSNFLKNTSFFSDNLRVLKGKASAFAELLAGAGFDLIFIDGAHDYESVRNDIKIAFSALKPGGLICGHDYHTAGKGVVRAVTELVAAVPSIKVKQVIDHTSIWFAVVETPRYEYQSTVISDLCNNNQLEEALLRSERALAEHGTEEMAKFVSAIKTEMLKKTETITDAIHHVSLLSSN